MHPRVRLITVLTLLLLGSTLAINMFSLPLNTRHVPPHAPITNDFLHAVKGQLVNSAGHEVRLTGVSWYGMETGSFAPEGLAVRNWQSILDQIVQSGFNTIRLPFSNQFLDDPASLPHGINYAINPDLRGLHGLGLLDHLIAGARLRGLKVILDRHRPTASGQTTLWYTDKVPESRWIADWVMLARHYRGNATILGADLHSEPHNPATWGTGDPKLDWRMAAERAGNAVLKTNPDWLIIVEGIEQYHEDKYWWGGNLQGAGKYPVRLSIPDKLVYSAHDYGPEVFPQVWFQSAHFPQNLIDIWLQHWAYLQLSGQAPVIVGEFGARSIGQNTEGIWLRHLLGFLKVHGFSYMYWAWNPGSADTGGLLMNNWKTPEQQKLRLLETDQAPLLDTPRRTFQAFPSLLNPVQPPV